jgi:PKD repeat protein
MKRKNLIFLTGMLLLTLCSTAKAQIQTLILRPVPADGKDAELTTYAPSTNYGWSPSFDANAWTVQGEPILIRSLLQFDLAVIPQDAEIISATLSLYCDPGSGHYQLNSGDNQSLLVRVAESWDENTVTWNNQPDVDLNAPVFIPTSTSTTQDYPDIDVTAHVQDMVSDPAHNYGWQIRLITEELYRSLQMSSSDNDAQYRPKLTIRYTTCDPPVAEWSYTVNDDVVHFADSSSASAFSWFWDFGDGYFSSVRNPVHQYATFGKYPVCLKVTDSCGTATRCDTVIFCPSLNTSFSSAITGFSAVFTDLSVNPNRWFWSFGDGFYSDLQHPMHVFNAPGTYYVCLTSGDNCTSGSYCDSVQIFPSGIHDLYGGDFLVYPVPAKDKIFIVTKTAGPEPSLLQVMDMTGIVLIERQVALMESGTQIDVSHLAPGQYVLKISRDNKVIVRKFIIIR